MYKIIIPITNIEIAKDFNRMNIKASRTIDAYIHPTLKETIGEFLYVRDGLWPFFYFEISDKSDGAEMTNYNLNHQSNWFLTFALWLVKDCSAFTSLAYLIDVQNPWIQVDQRDSFLTNSRGEYSTTVFSEVELNAAMNYAQCIMEAVPDNCSLGNAKKMNDLLTSNFVNSDYNNISHLQRILNFIQLARQSSIVPYKISMYIVALESIFGEGKSDLMFKLSYRIPHFIGTDVDNKNEIYKTIKKAYDVRSCFLHGSKLDKAKTLEDQKILSMQLDSMLRLVIQTMLNDPDKRSTLLDKASLVGYFHDKLIG